LDIRHTAEEHLVLMHDSTVDRTTHGVGKVSDMTLAEVTSLKLKAENDIGPIEGDFECDYVPGLAQAFELTRDRVFIDLDTKTSRIDLVVAAIVAAGMVDQVYVSVSDSKRAQEARAIHSEIRIQIRPDTSAELAAHLLLFPERSPEIIEVPQKQVALMFPQVSDLGVSLFADVFETDAIARLVGLDSADYQSFYADGAKIVQSEYPGAVLKALSRN